MDLDAFRWLLTDDGQHLLARAAEAPEDPLRAQTELRRTSDPAHVAAALTQVTLRRRAEAKFGEDAARMYFTPEGLEQATRRPVAAHRAARLTAASTRTVVDLGCGIGGDLMATARAGIICAGQAESGQVCLGDRDSQRVQVDATAMDTGPFDVAFADPARRTGRGRTFDADDWTPPWPFVEGLLRRDACVKVAPGIPHDLVPDGVEAEWVSDHGEVKEAALWSGRLATTRRRATVIGHGGLATLTEDDDPGADVLPVRRFLYEPDGAVIRAGLVTAVAAAAHGGLVDTHIAYVTSDVPVDTPFARGFEVLEELPYREKPLRGALRERGVGTLTIKKRGVNVVPEQLRKRLALPGDTPATIVLTRVAGRGTALLVRPL